jgi:hypothetical protein
VHSSSKTLNFLAQSVIKAHLFPAFGFAIKDSPRWNASLKHLFQAECLCAELNAIGRSAMFVTRSLVFNRVGPPKPLASRHGDTLLWCFTWDEFDNVGLAGKPKTKRVQREGAADQNAWARLNPCQVRFLVQKLTFGGEEVLLPLLFKVN